MDSESLNNFYESNKTVIILIIIALLIALLIWYAIRCTTHQSNWWCHQTVKFRPGQLSEAEEGQINQTPQHAEVPPPTNLRWDTQIPQTQEFAAFINTYFDQDTTYPIPYLHSLLTNHPDTNIILLRSISPPHQIQASMLLRPITINIRRRKITCHYIDLLCIHPSLRKQKLNEKMMDKLLHILNDKPNDICIYQIDKRPLPYEPTAKLQNYLLDLRTTNPHHLPTQNFELKTYNGEPELTKLLIETSALDTNPYQLTQNFTPEEFQSYFVTDPTYRISFYRLDHSSPYPNFCAVYFMNTTKSPTTRLAEIVHFQGSPQFLKQVLQKLKTLNVKHVNALESTFLRPFSHLIPLGFKPSEPTFIHMYNYQTKEQISPENVNFNQP